MNRLDSIFADARARGSRLLMPFVCGGFPGPGATGPLLGALERAGAAVVEVGIPFSDPIADGPVIAAAMHKAIQAGATPRRVLDEVGEARGSVRMGLVAMVSVSIVERLGGREGFIAQASEAGFDGLIIPDLPLEEAETYGSAARDLGLSFSLLAAPTTPRERLVALAQASSGFVYLLARTGITGERADAPEVAERVAVLRKVTELPIACGFGISTAEHVRAVVAHADAAIVGSAMVRRIEGAASAGRDPAGAAEAFARELVEGLLPTAG